MVVEYRLFPAICDANPHFLREIYSQRNFCREISQQSGTKYISANDRKQNILEILENMNIYGSLA